MDKLMRIATKTAIAFMVFILVLTVIGTLLQNDIELYSDMSSVFIVPQSIHYSTVFQVILACFSISAWNVMIEESKVYRNMMFLWKFILQMTVSILICFFYIALFDWFPITSIQAWIAFFISFLSSMGIAITLMVYKTKKEDKVYQNLFEEYKKKHKGE